MNNFIKNRGWQHAFGHLQTLASFHFLLCSSFSQLEHAPLYLFFFFSLIRLFFFFSLCRNCKHIRGRRTRSVLPPVSLHGHCLPDIQLLQQHLAELQVSAKVCFSFAQHALRFFLNLCNSIHTHITAQQPLLLF